MRIDISQNNYLDIAPVNSSAIDWHSCVLSLELRANEYYGKSSSEFDRNDIESFLSELAQLKESLKGEASLGVDGFSSSFIGLAPVNSTGALALSVTLRDSAFQPTRTSLSHTFSFYTSQLDEICDSLSTFFASIRSGA
jgi:hypothetical protein